MIQPTTSVEAINPTLTQEERNVLVHISMETQTPVIKLLVKGLIYEITDRMNEAMKQSKFLDMMTIRERATGYVESFTLLGVFNQIEAETLIRRLHEV